MKYKLDAIITKFNVGYIIDFNELEDSKACCFDFYNIAQKASS